jgi:hypothetical protein
MSSVELTVELTAWDQAVGPHDARLDHERLVLEACDVAFDRARLPLHYVPDQPFTTHMLNVLHLLLPAVDYLAVSPAARASQ